MGHDTTIRNGWICFTAMLKIERILNVNASVTVMPAFAGMTVKGDDGEKLVSQWPGSSQLVSQIFENWHHDHPGTGDLACQEGM